MPSVNSRGLPLYDGAPGGDPMPAWHTAFNGLSNALATALDAADEADHAADSCLTIALLPPPEECWPGRIIFVEENDMLYVHDGTGWWIYGGKLPFFFGTRISADVLADASQQPYITSEDTSRGISLADGVLTFLTPGIYRIDETVAWEPNGAGQRNLGILGTGIDVLGPAEVYAEASGIVTIAQSFATYISVNAPGSTATPYVTHNSGAALAVGGHVTVMWVSA